MFIAVQTVKNKNNTYKYVKLYESSRSPDTGKVVTKVIKNYGRLDKLEKERPGFYEELKAKYETESEAARQEEVRDTLNCIDINTQKYSFMTEGQNYANTLHYGQYVLRQIWKDLLKLPQTFNYIEQVKGECNFDLNAVISMLAFKKAMGPSSILNTFKNKSKFLGAPLEDVCLKHFYQALDVLESNRELIFKRVNASVSEKYGEDRFSLLFYDVTNSYFETSMTDEEKGLEQDDYLENLIAMIEAHIDEGLLSSECLTPEGAPNLDVIPEEFWDDVADKKIKYLRQRGPSKEHRFDLPLISIVLVIDRYGIPVEFQVFPGNKSEFKSMRPVIESLQSKYSISDAFVVADRGLNSAENLKMLQDLGIGFIVAQKISQLSLSQEAVMLDEAGYSLINPDNPDSGRYKIIDDYKKSIGKGQSVSCKLLFTYSEKRKRRDNALLDQIEGTLQKKIKDGAKIGLRKGGWAAFAKVEGDAKDKKVIGIDTAYLKKKRALAGYACIVFSMPEHAQHHPDIMAIKDSNIACVYTRLNIIERCFRILKSNIGLRPMFVRTSTHIKGHVMLCFLALLLLCLLEKKLKDRGYCMSIDQITFLLSSMMLTKVPNSTTNDAIYLPHKIGENNTETFTYTDTIDTDGIPQEKPIEQGQFALMSVVELKPLPSVAYKKDLSYCLRTKFPSSNDCDVVL